MKTVWKIVPLVVGAAVTGCAHVKVDPIEVKTIHIVHDVNISVDKQLEDFFAFQEQQAARNATTTTAPTTQTTAAGEAARGEASAAHAGDVR